MSKTFFLFHSSFSFSSLMYKSELVLAGLLAPSSSSSRILCVFYCLPSLHLVRSLFLTLSSFLIFLFFSSSWEFFFWSAYTWCSLSLTHSNFDFEKRKIFLKFITISCLLTLSLSLFLVAGTASHFPFML